MEIDCWPSIDFPVSWWSNVNNNRALNLNNPCIKYSRDFSYSISIDQFWFHNFLFCFCFLRVNFILVSRVIIMIMCVTTKNRKACVILVMLGQVQLSAHEKKVSLLLFLFMTLSHKKRGGEIFHTMVSMFLSCRHVLTWHSYHEQRKNVVRNMQGYCNGWLISWGCCKQFINIIPLICYISRPNE